MLTCTTLSTHKITFHHFSVVVLISYLFIYLKQYFMPFDFYIKKSCKFQDLLFHWVKPQAIFLVSIEVHEKLGPIHWETPWPSEKRHATFYQRAKSKTKLDVRLYCTTCRTWAHENLSRDTSGSSYKHVNYDEPHWNSDLTNTEIRMQTPMDLAYMCVKPPLPNTKCVHVCVTKCVCLNPQRSSLRSLTFARFARTFFNSLN